MGQGPWCPFTLAQQRVQTGLLVLGAALTVLPGNSSDLIEVFLFEMEIASFVSLSALK